jgi:NDP-sugar pyrophosphorylase family protein
VPYSAERELFPKLLGEGQRVWSYTSRSYWKDIGTPSKYLQAHIDILEGRLPSLPIGDAKKSSRQIRLGKNCKLHASVRMYEPCILGNDCQVAEEAQIGEFVVLGDDVKIGPRAILQRCVLWDEVQVGEGARLSGCVVGSGCTIGRNAIISPGTILGDHAVIPDFSRV